MDGLGAICPSALAWFELAEHTQRRTVAAEELPEALLPCRWPLSLSGQGLSHLCGQCCSHLLLNFKCRTYLSEPGHKVPS